MTSRLLNVVVLIILAGVVSALEKNLKKDFQCIKEGRFPDPKDCGGFIDCLPDEEGNLVQRLGTCRGRAYDPAIKRCVDLQKVEGCKPRNGRALVSDPKLDYVCGNATTEFVCADCKTLVNCVNGTAFPEPCSHGDLCAVKKIEFGGGVCYPKEPRECLCDKPNEFKIDNYDNSRFLFCEDKNSDPVIYQCPEDHFFDQETSQCQNSKGLPECEKIGVFADPNDCTFYYNCIFTKTGWVQKKFSCNNDSDSDLMYNEATGRCEDPCEWNTGSFTCQEEGRFPDPQNCQRYYDCIEDPSSGGYREILHECPEGYVWDPSARKNFGHCVLEGTSLTPCENVSFTKCVIPDGLCPAN